MLLISSSLLCTFGALYTVFAAAKSTVKITVLCASIIVSLVVFTHGVSAEKAIFFMLPVLSGIFPAFIVAVGALSKGRNEA